MPTIIYPAALSACPNSQILLSSFIFLVAAGTAHCLPDTFPFGLSPTLAVWRAAEGTLLCGLGSLYLFRKSLPTDSLRHHVCTSLVIRFCFQMTLGV